jgi:geranylgeranyl diphosphate synthase, type I
MIIQEQTMQMQPAVEFELERVVNQSIEDDYPQLRSMLRYHLGWEGEGSGRDAQGKRVRPLLVLLTTSSAGGDWQSALPAAAAVELIHNFSLIHDDIQDQSPMRRGRSTVWVKWGVAQAINAGDLMFTLAHLSLLNLKGVIPAEDILSASQVLHQTCVQLTKGQFLDIWNESEKSIPMDAYWPMISGKTASLLACCTELGAIVAGAGLERRNAFREFGYKLGLAFQVQDDWLGIWGNSSQTGKSTDSDLVSGKKTLPVLYAIQQQKQFAQRWANGPITASEVPELAQLLIDEGAQTYTERLSNQLTLESLEALDAGSISNEAGAALRNLAKKLLGRYN